jgi:hypothetical protein
MAETVEVNTWRPKIPIMSRQAIIRFQLMIHCHVEQIHISSADLDCLTLLGQKGKAELTAFCDLLTSQDIFKSSQSSRNAITRLQDKKLVLKEGRNKKKISIHPNLKIQNNGNIMVDVKCFSPQQNEAIQQ